MDLKQEQFIEQLYHTYFHELEIHAYRFTGDWDMVKPIVQDAFCIACRKVDDLMHSPNPVGWLKNTVKYVSKNALRQKQRANALLASWDELQEQIGNESDFSQDAPLEEYRGKLKEDDFYLLQRIVADGMDFPTVAKELNIGLWACRKRYQRILKRCQTFLSAPSDD